MRFSVLPRFSYNDLLKPFLIGSFTPIKFHESLWSICNFWANSPKSIVLSLQFVYELKLSFHHPSQVDGCLRGDADAWKKQWSAGSFYVLVRRFLSRVPKGLGSSKIIDSRINITFFNFPDTFRRYIRYVFEIAVESVYRARCYNVCYIALAILRTEKFKLMTPSYLQGESQVSVFHLLLVWGWVSPIL